jgi:hypothetical protein
MSPSTLRAIAGTLKHYAERYEQLAVAFEAAAVDALEVSNADGLKTGMDKIARHLAMTNHALDKHMGDSLVPLIERQQTKSPVLPHAGKDVPLIVAENRKHYKKG